MSTPRPAPSRRSPSSWARWARRVTSALPVPTQLCPALLARPGPGAILGPPALHQLSPGQWDQPERRATRAPRARSRAPKATQVIGASPVTLVRRATKATGATGAIPAPPPPCRDPWVPKGTRVIPASPGRPLRWRDQPGPLGRLAQLVRRATGATPVPSEPPARPAPPVRYLGQLAPRAIPGSGPRATRGRQARPGRRETRAMPDPTQPSPDLRELPEPTPPSPDLRAQLDHLERLARSAPRVTRETLVSELRARLAHPELPDR